MAQISLQKLEADLASLTDNFANLVRSARIADESDEAKRPSERRVPGDMMEVLAEKVVAGGQSLLRTVAELKRRALLADAAAANSAVAERSERYSSAAGATNAALRTLRDEVASTVQELEEHYYSSKHRRPLEPDGRGGSDSALTELYKTALDVPQA
ncbi:hypothetical protein WJX81_004312 [Elliptochloris bilobata]|uniref:Mediator of RNA polymerase II transcription subunit 22 n=1 Tax=Elliptochloris bilobata TaxID=381761 RepID=A0AAW1S850_9CHLO